jgi:hypothetical protein
MTVVVPPPPPVPPTLPAARVNIPVYVQVPNESGPQEAKVQLQGFVDCRDVPLSIRPKKCARAGGSTAGFRPQLISGLVPVTPLVRRNFGRVKPRAVTINLHLNPLGQRLFAKLQRYEQSRILPVHVSGTIGDRQGKTTTEQFPVVFLERHR